MLFQVIHFFIYLFLCSNIWSYGFLFFQSSGFGLQAQLGLYCFTPSELFFVDEGWCGALHSRGDKQFHLTNLCHPLPFQQYYPSKEYCHSISIGSILNIKNKTYTTHTLQIPCKSLQHQPFFFFSKCVSLFHVCHLIKALIEIIFEKL